MRADFEPNDVDDDEGGLPFDPRLVLAFLREQKWLILGIATSVAVAATFWTLKQPKVYEAVCTIEYDPNPARPLRGQIQDVADPIGSFWATKEYFETQNRILESRSLAERVVRELGLHNSPDFLGVPADERDEFEGVAPEIAARRLQGNLNVKPDEDSRLVEIQVRDNDPARAMLIANTLASTYIEKTMEDRMGTTVEALNWLNERLESLQGELRDSEDALHDFKESHNVLSLSLTDRQNIIASTIEQMNESLTAAQTRRIEIAARLAQLRAANRDDPMEVEATFIANDPAVMELRTRYRQKAAERDAFAERYGANHPTMRAIDQELGSINTEMRRAIDGLISRVASDLREVRATEAGFSAALDDVHQRGLELNLREIEYARLNRARENNENLYKMILERTTETNLTKGVRVSNARLVDRALTPSVHVAPRLSVNVVLGLAAGLMLGLFAAFVRSRMDRTLRSVEDAEALGITVLGVVPKIDQTAAAHPRDRSRKKRRRPPASHLEAVRPDLIVHDQPQSAVAESCRAIRTNLMFMAANRPLRNMVITSPGPQDGKTTVAVSLAISLAQSGKKVLLVDTDLRRPRVHKALNISGHVGVTSVIVGDVAIEDAVQASEVPGLAVFAAGPIPPNPAELLHGANFAQLIKDLSTRFDIVIFDSPPVSAVTDAAIVAPQVDGVLVVTRARSTTRDALRAALRQLKDVNANIFGGVLNGVDVTERSYGGGSYHYYYYGSDENRPGGPAAGGPTPIEAASVAKH